MLFLLFLCAFGVSAAWSLRSSPPYALEDAELHFENFIQEHGKQYADEIEKRARFQIFKENLEEVNRLNEGQDDAVFGLTFFMDLTHEEFRRSYTGLGQNGTEMLVGRTYPCAYAFDEDIEDVLAPESFDWRKENVVTPVKNQMDCNSCYAFSALGNIESQYAIKYGLYLDLSEQQIIDCDANNNGCIRGFMSKAFRYLIETGGSVGENDYPYNTYGGGVEGLCHFNQWNVIARVADCRSYVLQSQEKLKQLLYSYGPISVAIQSSGIKAYREGLLRDARCGVGDVDHAVLLVGYGTTENGEPFWIAKNSWGPNWGEQGFLYMSRGDNVQSCGMMNNYYMSAAIIP